jgi:hypothetical protein
VTKVVLADCRNGLIVRIGDRWGVVSTGKRNGTRDSVVVDFWDGGREYVKSWTVVEVQA